MNHRTWLVMGLAASLAACAVDKHGEQIGADGLERQANVRVVRCVVDIVIDDDDIVLTHEPVHTRRCSSSGGDDSGRVVVVWTLPPPPITGASYSFANPGITFDKEPIPKRLPVCRPGANDQRFRCRFDTRTGLHYAYSIHILRNGVAWKSIDPTVVND